tara:strand:+ start:278 stop:721 length:444 start_codon:yes stop_codon:yes gene_type:complete
MSDEEKALRSTTYPLQTLSPVIKPDNMTLYKAQQANAVSHYVKQEYDRLLAQAEVINKQFQELQRRVKITEVIENSRYRFKPVAGHIYYLYQNATKQTYQLSILSPSDWALGMPDSYLWVADVRKLGDSTWDVENFNKEFSQLFPDY